MVVLFCTFWALRSQLACSLRFSCSLYVAFQKYTTCVLKYTVLHTMMCFAFHFPHRQLTPLAELSIPRRSTTAPTGLPPSTTSAAGALMSPHQFAHSTSTTVVAGTDSASDGGHAQVGEGSKVTTKGAEPVGLSRDQLQQALLYLIKVHTL